MDSDRIGECNCNARSRVVVVHDGVPMARLSARFWYLPESRKRRENPSRDAFTADIGPLIGLAGETRSAPRPTALDPDPQTLKKAGRSVADAHWVIAETFSLPTSSLKRRKRWNLPNGIKADSNGLPRSVQRSVRQRLPRRRAPGSRPGPDCPPARRRSVCPAGRRVLQRRNTPGPCA